MHDAISPPLYLASTSVYRQQLLSKLTAAFTAVKPDVDETPLPAETASQLVYRLALAKANSIAGNLQSGLVIGSDQVAVFANEIIGKPHTTENAVKQLTRFSGQTVTFLTGLALLDSRSGRIQIDCVPFTVHFRPLSEAQIMRYLSAEQPFDCAGSFKAEGLGISLFRSTEGSDSNSLIGLPLIRLVDMLQASGIDIP